MPKIPRALTPTTKRMPMLMSCAIWNAGPMAKPANESKAAPTDSTGASQKTSLSALSGMMSSLMSNFTASAMGCSSPCGPTRMGQPRLHVRHKLAFHQYDVTDDQRQNGHDGNTAEQRRPESLQELDGRLNNGTHHRSLFPATLPVIFCDLIGRLLPTRYRSSR